VAFGEAAEQARLPDARRSLDDRRDRSALADPKDELLQVGEFALPPDEVQRGVTSGHPVTVVAWTAAGTAAPWGTRTVDTPAAVRGFGTRNVTVAPRTATPAKM
jgi:hypothetical protein